MLNTDQGVSDHRKLSMLWSPLVFSNKRRSGLQARNFSEQFVEWFHSLFAVEIILRVQDTQSNFYSEGSTKNGTFASLRYQTALLAQ